jgi:hypothetical protein
MVPAILARIRPLLPSPVFTGGRDPGDPDAYVRIDWEDWQTAALLGRWDIARENRS